MRLATGVDLIEIQRLQDAIGRHGDRFLQRIFTSHELLDANGSLPSLAARFAAKEAVAKALQTGIGLVAWREIEIRTGPYGEPVLLLHGTAASLASELGLSAWSLSLSHTATNAIALVVALGEPAA